MFFSQQLHIYNDEFTKPSFTPFECFDVTRCSLWETNAFLMHFAAALRLTRVRTCSCRHSGLIVPTEGHVLCRTLTVKKPQKTFFCWICFVFPHCYPPWSLGHVYSVHAEGLSGRHVRRWCKNRWPEQQRPQRFPKNPPHHPKINQQSQK